MIACSIKFSDNKFADEKFPYINKTGSDAVARTLRFMEDNFRMPLKLADIVDIAEMFDSICADFSKNMHTSPVDYLNKVKINKAKEKSCCPIRLKALWKQLPKQGFLIAHTSL